MKTINIVRNICTGAGSPSNCVCTSAAIFVGGTAVSSNDGSCAVRNGSGRFGIGGAAASCSVGNMIAEDNLCRPRAEEFLMHLKVKAGMPPGHWSPTFQALRFTAQELAADGLDDPAVIWQSPASDA